MSPRSQDPVYVDFDDLYDDPDADLEDDVDAPYGETSVDPLEALFESLQDRTLAELRAIARGFGWRLSGTKRDDVLAQVVGYFADPQAVAAGIEALPSAKRELLQLIAWLVMGTEDELADGYERLVGALPLEAAPERFDHGDDALAAAWEAGLIQEMGSSEFDRLGVPPVLLAALPAPWWTPRAAVTPAWRVEPAGDGLALVLVAALALAEEGPGAMQEALDEEPMGWDGRWPVRPGQAPVESKALRAILAEIPPTIQMVSQQSLDHIARALGDDDRDRASFAVAVLAELELLAEAETEGPLVRRTDVEEWLQGDAWTGFAEAAFAWVHARYPLWDEVSQLAQADGALRTWRVANDWRFSMEDYTTQRAVQRSDLFFGLARLRLDLDDAQGGWVDGAALGRLLLGAKQHRFLPLLPTEGWFLGGPDGTILVPGAKRTDRVAADLLARIVRGPMRYLGLVETAVAPDGQGWAVRLAPLGRAVAGAGKNAVLGQDPVAAWDAGTATLTLVPSLPAAALLDAARSCTTLVGTAPEGSLPGAIAFRLEPEAAARAFDGGLRPEDIAARFEAAGAPLPDALRASIEGWWARWGTVNLYDGLALIETADEALARVLRASLGRELDDAVLYQPSPTAFVVAEADVDALLQAMQRGGHTPRVVEGTGSGKAPSAVLGALAARKAARSAAAAAERTQGKRGRGGRGGRR